MICLYGKSWNGWAHFHYTTIKQRATFVVMIHYCWRCRSNESWLCNVPVCSVDAFSLHNDPAACGLRSNDSLLFEQWNNELRLCKKPGRPLNAFSLHNDPQTCGLRSNASLLSGAQSYWITSMQETGALAERKFITQRYVNQHANYGNCTDPQKTNDL